jgi:hypothetical protein
MALSMEEMELEAVEFIPAREVMCGGYSGGGSSTTINSQSFNHDGNGDGNGSVGLVNGVLDGDANNDNVNIFL